MVIGVDMSSIVDHAKQIVKDNKFNIVTKRQCKDYRMVYTKRRRLDYDTVPFGYMM